MIETVVKRSGSKEPYDASKMEKSVREAARDAGVEGEEVETAVRAVSDAVTENAGDRTEVAATDIRGWALTTLDKVNPACAEAWRTYDAKQGK